MDRCHYCGNLKGGHKSNCPHPHPNLDMAHKPWSPEVQTWHRGYADGRAGRAIAEKDPVYVMGWVKGTAALEEYENGYQMWGAAD